MTPLFIGQALMLAVLWSSKLICPINGQQTGGPEEQTEDLVNLDRDESVTLQEPFYLDISTVTQR